MSKQVKFSRRRFLQLAALTTASAMITACAPKGGDEGDPSDDAGVPSVDVKEVRIMLASWAAAEVPFDRMAREFSDMREDVEIKIDTSVDDVKLLAQISAGKVEWCGLGIITPFLNIVTRVESGLIQPMEDLVRSSSEEGADTLLDDIIPSIKEDSSYKGHFYSLPYSFENITFNWRVDYFKEVGWDKPPATWNEWYEVAVALKEWGKDEEITPTSWVGSLWTDVGALICSAMEKPYTDEGMVNWMDQKAIDALAFYRKMVDAELTPPHGFDDWWPTYQRGKLASVQAQSSRGVWGQKIHGEANVATAPIPELEKGSGVGTVYWGNGLGIINKAPYPQELADFYVYAFGPANQAFQKAVISSGKTPIYDSSYTDIIEGDPMFGAYRWMIDMRDIVANSSPVPRNTFYLIQHQAYQKRIVEFTEDSTMTPEQCAGLILQDAQEEIEKQKVK